MSHSIGHKGISENAIKKEIEKKGTSKAGYNIGFFFGGGVGFLQWLKQLLMSKDSKQRVENIIELKVDF